MRDKIIFTAGVAISLIIIGISGWLYYKSTQLIVNSEKLIIKTTQEPVATTKLQETIDYKNTEIQVLNGSGKAGLAKTFADKLEKLGFVKVTTGNYTETITGNLLLAPTDFGLDINLENYTFKKSKDIKIIIGK